ncbi:MAG: fumarate reductase subunit D [Deltaproteobacteria bacterium]|nr:fumarate reductase subunit D [Deltaproteobacteria bacterium]
MNPTCKQTKEPVFWVLFGAGGMLGAICAPALILTLLLLYPYCGEGGQPGLFYRFLETGTGRLCLALFISLSAWCGLHRIVHCLRDVRACTGSRARLCYGLALLMTLLSLAAVFF